MDWARYLAAGLTGVYGVLIVISGVGMIRAGEEKPSHAIPTGFRYVWTFLGLAIIGIVFSVGSDDKGSMWILVTALVAVHVLAVMNGLWMHGKLNPSHHLIRGVFSAVVTVLAYVGLFG